MRETWLAWPTQPEYIKIFVGYLVIAVSISVIRAMRIIKSHCSLSKKVPISLNGLRDGSIHATMLSDLALANKISHEPLPISPPAGETVNHTERTIPGTLRLADIRFRFLWEKSYQAAKSMERLCLLTVLLSFLVFFYSLSWILRGDFPSEGQISLGVLLLANIAQRTSVLVLGIAAS